MTVGGFHFNTTYTTLPPPFFTHGCPDRVPHPRVIMMNHSLAESLGLTIGDLTHDQQSEILSGNALPNTATPFSQAYAGHQFGHFTMLGDGRAHVLGEHIAPNGRRLDIQFKGSGRTPYSRGGDGKAPLGPMLREYIIAEAMHSLGIPTTRSLAVVTTGESVMRDTALPGSILTRVAQSHIRVGTFEFAARLGDVTAIQAIMMHTIQRHYPHCMDAPNPALALIDAVMQAQIDLMVHWMRVGFIHGVMNTDNTALSGETIDYGPCAFMDGYDPHTVFSSIDQWGRYAYANQPRIAQWNLIKLAETLVPLIDHDDSTAVHLATALCHQFSDRYRDQWLIMMRNKLGMVGSQPDDATLISDLLHWMHHTGADYTNTFRDLSQPDPPMGQEYDAPVFKNWWHRWQARRGNDSTAIQSSIDVMRQTNPAIIPRNHIVEQALTAAITGDITPVTTLMAALQTPYEDGPVSRYRTPPTPQERVHQTVCGT